MMGVNPPHGVNRLMTEAEQTARRMVCDAADELTECRTRISGTIADHIGHVTEHHHRPPDAGAIQTIRQNVMDAAHLHDDLLAEVLSTLELGGYCTKSTEYGDGIPCEPEMVEQGQGCWYCTAVFKLRRAGVTPTC